MASRFSRILGGDDKTWLETNRAYESWRKDRPDAPAYEPPSYPNMTYKGWSPSGIVDGTMLAGKELGISDEGWQYVVNILSKADVASIPFSFLVAVDQAVSVYHYTKELVKRALPKASRDQLKQLLGTAKTLIEQVETLSSHNVVQLISNSSFDPLPLQKQIRALIEAANLVLSNAPDYPSRGRLPDFATLNLGVALADAVHENLGSIRITMTKGGVFSDLLSAVVLDASGTEPKDVDKLVRQIIRSWRADRGNK